ncbi:hypothetical protein VP01_425g2 [Puccinia sorghi]|uniref:Uncharacterized protein n=1 Tax=Puccinia sorghi TaxID=27349 RepID=A0A0L6UR80_9BASI|nr:hypothetical protein VP01_425g2 [Puccinia sorghi]
MIWLLTEEPSSVSTGETLPEIGFKMVVTSSAHNDGEVASTHHQRNASHSPPAILSLYHSNFNTIPLVNGSLIPPLYPHQEATMSPHMSYDYRPHAPESSGKYHAPRSADGISPPPTDTVGLSSAFSNPQSAAILSAKLAPDCGTAGLTSVSASVIDFDYSTPASSLHFPSPVVFSGELPSTQCPPACDPLASCPPLSVSLEHQLLPSASSHDSPISWANQAHFNNALSSAPLSSSNSSLTYSDPAASNSSSRSWTPDQNDTSNASLGHSELTNTYHQFAPLGSPAQFEKLPVPHSNNHGQASPPDYHAEYHDWAPRRIVSNQRPAINTSDASSDGLISLLSQRSPFYEDSETLIPSPFFSPHPTHFRAHQNEPSKENCPPMTPLNLDQPRLRLMNTSTSFGMPPGWFEPEIYPPINADVHSTYEGNCSPHLFLTTRNAPDDPLSRVSRCYPPESHSGIVNPDHASQSTPQAGSNLLSDSSGHVSLEPTPRPKEARVAGCNKKKKREVREVDAFCIVCGERMARLTLRGSPEELYVADGFDVIHTCKACHEGKLPVKASVRSDVGGALLPERPCLQIGKHQEVTSPEPAPQGATTTFRKRNRRTDDVTAITTCDCCSRQLGVGGIVPRNGRSAIQFVVEVVCAHCVNNFRRCTDCGGGGGSRLGVGKWRCKELFSDGRRTCILSHQRKGASNDVITTVWRVRQLTENPELDTLAGQLQELVKHSLYAALATPEILESGLARVTTFDEIKTMYANGWKQIKPLIYEDVEASKARRRYVSLRWTKPHPRKGPKRGAPNSCDQLSTSAREGDMVLEPGKELSGFVLSEWDMHEGTFFVQVAMPWQSGDALESTAGLSHKSFIEAKADRERLVNDLVRRGTNLLEANLRYPPIRHLWTMLFFHQETRLVQFLEKRRKFMPLEEYLRLYPDAKRHMFPPARDCYVPCEEQLGWSVWVRRENGNPTPQ